MICPDCGHDNDHAEDCRTLAGRDLRPVYALEARAATGDMEALAALTDWRMVVPPLLAEQSRVRELSNAAPAADGPAPDMDWLTALKRRRRLYVDGGRP